MKFPIFTWTKGTLYKTIFELRFMGFLIVLHKKQPSKLSANKSYTYNITAFNEEGSVISNLKKNKS